MLDLDTANMPQEVLGAGLNIGLQPAQIAGHLLVIQQMLFWVELVVKQVVKQVVEHVRHWLVLDIH